MELWHFSITALAITAALCLVGTFAPNYRDNFAQRLGMGLLCFGCVARIEHLWWSERVSPEAFVLHSGLVMYAIGTAWKQSKLCRKVKT